jgi:hypothetical protein
MPSRRWPNLDSWRRSYDDSFHWNLLTSVLREAVAAEFEALKAGGSIRRVVEKFEINPSTVQWISNGLRRRSIYCDRRRRRLWRLSE